MIFVLAPSTILNRWTLRACRLPKLMLTEAQKPLPRRLVLSPAFWRMTAESALLRNAAVVAPIPAAILVAPDLVTASLALSPILLLLMLFAEGNLVPVRARVGEADEADRVLDLLRLRGRSVLARIVAGRGIVQGRLTLVVEQSSLARLPPITLISVRNERDNSVIDLTTDEQKALRNGLFGDGLDEGALKRVNLIQKTPRREVSLEAASVSAHARLAGMARGTV